MDGIIFLYDKLMLKKEQRMLELQTEFLSYAVVHGKMYWFDDQTRNRVFMLPTKNNSTALIYGALYKVEDIDVQLNKFHSYYYSSAGYTQQIAKTDFYKKVSITAIPIKFKSIIDLSTSSVKKGEPVAAITFVGNELNKTISYNSSKRYYKVNGIDVDSFIKLTEEKQKEKR